MKKILLVNIAIALFSYAATAMPFSWGKMLLPKSYYGDSKPRAIKYNNGFIYVYGAFKDTIDLDMGNGTKYVNSYNTYSASGFLAKYDLQGNFVWGGSLKGIKTGNPNCIAPPYNEILDMTFDANNNVYITGYYDDSVRFEFGGIVKGLKCPCGVSSFIVKVSPNGDVATVNHVTGLQCPTYFSGNSIAMDNANGLYTMTDFYGTGDFDFSAAQKIYNHQVYSKFNVVVSRYNKTTMALEWSGMLESNKNLYGERVLVDNNKNMYVCGKFTGTIDIDFTAGVNNITSADTAHFDYFIIKYDSNGNYQWVNRFNYGGGFEFDVAMDNSNHIIIAGTFKDYISMLHNNVSQGNLLSNGAAEDIFCIKMDLSGNITWSKRIGGTYDDYYTGMSVAYNDNIVLNAWFNLATSLDPLSATNDYLVTGMATNGLLTCLSPNGDFVFGGVTNALANANNGGIGGAIYTCSVWDPSGNLYMAGQNIWQSDINPDTNANASDMVNNTNNNFNTFVMKLGTNLPSNIIDQNDEDDITCYPSPAETYCSIRSANDIITAIEIYNSMGQRMIKAQPLSKSYQLDLHAYTNGLYYIKYTLGDKTGYRSILVSK